MRSQKESFFSRKKERIFTIASSIKVDVTLVTQGAHLLVIQYQWKWALHGTWPDHDVLCTSDTCLRCKGRPRSYGLRELGQIGGARMLSTDVFI